MLQVRADKMLSTITNLKVRPTKILYPKTPARKDPCKKWARTKPPIRATSAPDSFKVLLRWL